MPAVRRKNNKIDGSTRERIIELVMNQGMTMASVARNFNIPASTVRSIVSTFIHTSRVEKLPRGGNRGSRVEQAHLDWLTENMDEFAGRPVQWLTT
jgi:transposase-like protein